MNKTLSSRSIAVLSLPFSVPALIKAGHAVVAAISGNPSYFPNPNPPLSTVSTSIDALDTAETATKTRAKGTVEARDAARLIVVSRLHDLKAYVQQRADADPPNAPKIITSAAMSVKKHSSHVKGDFVATAGQVSGSVHLVARAVSRRASYEWQWSSDGGKTWVLAPATLQAKTTITGLPVAVSCQFRFRPVLKTGESDWGQVIAFLVK